MPYGARDDATGLFSMPDSGVAQYVCVFERVRVYGQRVIVDAAHSRLLLQSMRHAVHRPEHFKLKKNSIARQLLYQRCAARVMATAALIAFTYPYHRAMHLLNACTTRVARMCHISVPMSSFQVIVTTCGAAGQSEYTIASPKHCGLIRSY